VLENKTGRILAMSGGFSYPLSQLNRTSQAMRQPGSAIKPLSYLAALRRGLQPNTLVSDEPITLPPIGRGRAREQDYWTPKNYDGGGGGILTLRRALENSRNLATVHLLDGVRNEAAELALPERGALPRRSGDADRRNAALDLQIDQLGKRVKIELSVEKGRHESRTDARKEFMLHKITWFFRCGY
jgi:membrane peptidoglycan carboxypeptidase